MAVFTNLNAEIKYGPATPFLGVYARELTPKLEKILEDFYPHVRSSISHNSQKVETSQVSVRQWMNKVKYIHTVNEYSALKRKMMITRSTIYMNLEDMLLTNQSQEDRCCMIPLP